MKFREHGDYWLFVERLSNETTSCDIMIANDPMTAELRKLYLCFAEPFYF